jgi:YVTN family beta-propeller protein
VRLYLRLFTLLIAAVWLARGGQHAEGQTIQIANRAFSQDQVFKVIGGLNAANGAPQEHSSVVVHQGYVVEVYSQENERPQAGIAVFDFGDPSAPRLVVRTEDDTDQLSEQHAIGISHQDGRDYAALLAIDGIEIWDWTDMTAPKRVSHLTLPGVEFGYARGAWWLAWQAPYLYVAGAANGLYIVNTSDPAHPFLVDRGDEPNPVPTSETGGFRLGPIFAVGNLLVASANDGRGYATLDISDPADPALLASLPGREGPPSYSAMLNGGVLYAVGTDDNLYGLDVGDPTTIRRRDEVALYGRGGYLTIQDTFAHVGASDHYVKVDLADPNGYRVVGSASSGRPDHDEDFAVAIGNLVVLGDDHYHGSFVFAHQAEPDDTGPAVNMVSPADGSRDQSRSSRIGVTFTDRVDLRTVHAGTFIVRPLDGEPVPGVYSSQTGIVNFAPAAPLARDTTYEIVIPAGGIRDVVGNPVATTFRATFATGDSAGSGFWCRVEPPAPVAVGQAATLVVTLLEGPGGVRFSWRFGDGSAPTPLFADTRATYAWSAPGHYPVAVTATDGRRSTGCSTLVTVYRRATIGVPQTSGTLALDRSGTQVWSVNPDNDSVTVVDAVHLVKMAELPAGRRPRTLAVAPDDTVWVANQASDSVSVIHGETRAPLATIALPSGSEPYGVAVSPTRGVVYVTLQTTGQLAEIDLAARVLRRRLDIGPAPRAIAVSADGNRIFVTRYISPVDQGEVVEIDAAAWTVTRRIPLAFDPGPDTEASGRGVPNGLAAAAISPDGSQLWVAGRKHNTARGMTRDGQPLTFDSTVRSMLAQIDVAAGQEELAARYDFNNRDGPVALQFSPLGDYLFVALEGSDAIDVIDAYSGQLITAIEGAGHAPQGLLFTVDGSKLFVDSWLSRSLRVYDTADLVTGRGRQAKLLVEILAVERDATPADVLAGKRIFYLARDSRMSRDGYIACASCHLDGREDGRVWDRTAEGEGLRNTISLLGKGRPGNGLLHWSANFDEIQDFDHDMRANFGGSGFLTQAQLDVGTRGQTLGDAKAGLSPELDALAAYVATLRELPPSPYRAPDSSLTPEAQAGRAIFLDAGCATCHSGPEFTDSPTGQLHQVGTLTPASGHRLGGELAGLDTPSLRGLWLSAPYLHDGSAATLADVLTKLNPFGQHGGLGHLWNDDPQAVDHLVAYLLQIDDREAAFDVAAPAIEFVSPQEGERFAAGRAVKLAVNTAPFLGPVAHVGFYDGANLIGSDSTVMYAYTWEGAPSGSHTLTARMIYTGSSVSISAPLTIEIVP